MADNTIISNTQCVWCVLVMLKEPYACGAAVVAQSLRAVATQYPIWCMVSDGISAECVDFLRRQFDNVVHVPLISHEVVPMRSTKQREIYGGWIHHSFTKWNILNPAIFPVNKVILLDADMLVLQNIDDLFNLEPPALTFSSPWARPYAKLKGAPNHYMISCHNGRKWRELDHGDRVPYDAIKAGLQGGILGLACMVLVKPTQKLFDNMLKILNENAKFGNSKCISGMDEQLLAMTLLTSDKPIHHIHQSYNWIVGKTDWLARGVKPKTQQYYHGKPWDEDPDVTEWQDIVQWWTVAREVMERSPQDSKWFYLGTPYTIVPNEAAQSPQ